MEKVVPPSSSSTLRIQQDPDVGLMLRVRHDDRQAFEQLVERYQSRLLTVLEHLVPRRDMAEDAVQEVFLRVYRARKNYQPQAKFSTWLFTIANNVASNARRTHGRKREVAVESTENAPPCPQTLAQIALAASGQLPSRQAVRAELGSVVRIAVDALSPRQRTAVLLAKFEGMSYEEIAEAMEMSVSAVKSLLTRARENLRILLAPYVDQGRVVRTSPSERD